ncbi:hypothetical protein ACFSKM_14390 [Ancylobacter dichloromethanicus]
MSAFFEHLPRGAQFFNRNGGGANSHILHGHACHALRHAGHGEFVIVDRNEIVDGDELVAGQTLLGIEQDQHSGNVEPLDVDPPHRTFAGEFGRAIHAEARRFGREGGEASIGQPIEANGAIGLLVPDPRLAVAAAARAGGSRNVDAFGGDHPQEVEGDLRRAAVHRCLCGKGEGRDFDTGAW